MTPTVASPSGTAAVQETFRVMGTDAHVIVVDGPTDAIPSARDQLEQLEARWSRFRADSELCRLNERAGTPVIVSDLTFALVDLACQWWARTGGAFDPTVLPALERAGYDRTFEDLRTSGLTDAAGRIDPAPGCGGIVLDPIARAMTLPPGVRIDLGGIAKGFAADVVAAQVLRSGAAGVCVNLGGDLRVSGRPPHGADAWVVAVDGPPGFDAEGPLGVVSLTEGAVATTSRSLRTWRRGPSTHHHVIDPRTGRPACTPWVSATVISGRAVDAEALAKAALLAPTPALASSALTAHGGTGVLVADDGTVDPLRGVEAFLVADCPTLPELDPPLRPGWQPVP